MKYSVIVLSFNKLACTQRCLTRLMEDTECPEPWELIVVDNGSTDGSAEWCAGELVGKGNAKGVPVRLIRLPENIGCSNARNLGIKTASGEMLAFVDNDVFPCTRRWLPMLNERLAATEGCGMVGPKLLYPPPSNCIQCAGVGISRRGHVCFRGRGEPADAPAYNEVREVQCLISACLMIPHGLIRKHGGFDPAFHPVQFEDFDLVYRLREQGYRAVYDPAVSMYHDESTTTAGSAGLNNAANVVRNGLLFQKRWRHLFAEEDGPSEEECRWKKIPRMR
ncbi:MAG: glycosyltransferase family 2 protein [Kiritimatiellae bacterium]|nr:glycosyltransferase family 2 protein [Kiritimatiellia bacterium]